MLTCMKRLAVSSRGVSFPPVFRVKGSVCSRAVGSGRGSREVPSALYSRSSKARGTRRRMRGFEGWRRHLRSGRAAAAKPTFALIHPSNLRETIRLTTPSSSSLSSPSQSQSPVRWFSRMKRGDGVGQGCGAAGRIHRAVPEERVEDAGQAAGERHDGDVLAAARGDAQGPGPRSRGPRPRAAGGAGLRPRLE